MKLASSALRKATAAAMSSGRPTRPTGYHPLTNSKTSGRESLRVCQTGVSIVPGNTTLARMPLGPYSIARVCVKEITPALAAL